MKILTLIKGKLKKILKLPLRVKTRQKAKKLQGNKQVSAENVKKEPLGAQETAIEQTKFYTGKTSTAPCASKKTLPADLSYLDGKDKIILQVRDPWWIHAYWEVIPATWERLKNELHDAFYQAKHILRIYDVSNIIFDGRNAHRFFDVEINGHVNNWYLDTAGPGRSWCVDFGLLFADGRFITIVRSNTVFTPLEGPSWLTDEEWMVPEEMFARLYGMGFGFGRSSPVGKLWQERIKRALFSGALASPGMASMASPTKKIAKEKKFWLVVNTELILYGATEPDATVLIQGRKIDLRADGTFSLRFALPDGKQTIPVEAVSSDKQDRRTVTPVVTKETR